MRIKFPHYTPEEKEVLKKFMEIGPLRGDWKFEVRLKSYRAEEAKGYPENIRRMWEAVTAKRIDAVCEDANYVHIIEVKKYMLLSGIGQLLMYKELYKEQYTPTKPIKLWYVTYYPDYDVWNKAYLYGINCWSLVR